MRKSTLLIACLALSMTACAETDGPGTTATPTTTGPTITSPTGTDVVAEFRTPDGISYRILLSGDAATQARNAHQAGEGPGIPVGRINRGDGGVNTGHDWHITDVEFADMAIEVCDGNAGYIDEIGFDEFVNQHGEYFCPWGAELIGLVDG